MAPSIIGNDAIQGEVFLPGQIFVFGGFILRANSLGHLEQIDSYAPGHQVRFGNLNYTADIRRDLIFDGFEPMLGAPHNHDEHDLALPSDCVREITPATALALNPEQIAPSEDVGSIVQVSKPDLMARGVALDLLQMAKRVGPQYEAAENEDLSGEESLALDRVVVNDRGSHQVFIATAQWNSQ